MTNVLKAMKKNKFHMHTFMSQGSPNLLLSISRLFTEYLYL